MIDINPGSIRSAEDLARALECLISDGMAQVGSIEIRCGNILDFIVDDCDEECESSEYIITVEPMELHVMRLAANEEQAPLIAAWRASGLSVAEAIARLRNHD
jgi:hypothetical protein